MRVFKLLILSTLLTASVTDADVASFPADEFPACADALAHGSIAIVEDPTSLDFCPLGNDTGGGGTFPPHVCVCDWDGAVGTWRLHSHGVIDNDLTVNGDLTLTSADPSIIYDSAVSGDTDFWMGVQDDAGGDDDDTFQIGKGTTPGTTPFMTIDSTGDVGIGTTSPDDQFHIENTPSDDVDDFSVNSDGRVTIGTMDSTNGVFTLEDQTLSSTTFAFLQDSGGDVWQFSIVDGVTDHFLINLVGSGGQEFRLNDGGNLVLRGDLNLGGDLIVDVGTGIGSGVLDGSLGGCLAMRDSDDGGWTCSTTLNGTRTDFCCLSPFTCADDC